MRSLTISIDGRFRKSSVASSKAVERCGVALAAALMSGRSAERVGRPQLTCVVLQRMCLGSCLERSS